MGANDEKLAELKNQYENQLKTMEDEISKLQVCISHNIFLVGKAHISVYETSTFHLIYENEGLCIIARSVKIKIW